ncbi:OLC1v1020970C1 [Oldenlandia corymbosa var. corymbosa]|uniref:OLC1v1020970C1 n=1 Tax=Oldenlandia corymbosa var. corymbosa TaxID=529605 RepID=A0AAV1BYC0_OLDCO|nr:OLC1v1020970C1 [Oldenlandia corymbosa var. corymbosa]
MEGKVLDYVLVPTGLVAMVAYHIWLLHRIMYRPATTVIGINAVNRRLWVRAMMEDPGKTGVLAVQTLRNNIMASTLLASTAIMLSSLIAVLMTGLGGGGTGTSGSSTTTMGLFFVYGDKSLLGFSIKFFCILVCFLLAFLFNVQSIRYYSHASILINVPPPPSPPHNHINKKNHLLRHRVTTEYVSTTVNRGSYFWSLGLRTFYFSFPLFLWMFGPIPMFLSCLVLVCLLYFLDVALHFGSVAQDNVDDEGVIQVVYDDQSIP